MVPCRLRRGAGDVRRGALCGGSTGGCRRGSEPSRGGPAVRHRPPDGEEDAELFGAAGIPPDEAGQAAEAGRVHRHRRRDPGGGHGSGRAAQAAPHGASDLRAAAGRARVQRRLYHREGLCPGPAAIDARGLRAAASPAGPCPGRLRRGGGGGRGQAGEGRLLLPDPAPFQPLVRQGVSPGDDGGLPRRPCQRLRLSRRGSALDPLRQHDPCGGADPGGRHAPQDAGVRTSSVTLPVPRPLRPARQGQRQGQGRGPGKDGAAPVWCRSRRCTSSTS